MAEKNDKYPEPTDADRMTLVAAVAATGPRIEFDDGVETDEEYTDRVIESVRIVSSLAEDSSRVMRSIMQLNNAVRYVANIVDVEVEAKTNRPLVQLEVKPSKKAPEGEEEIRGLMLPNKKKGWKGEPGAESLHEQLQDLVDHRVLVFKGYDPSEDKEKGYKKIVAVRDLGEARDFD